MISKSNYLAYKQCRKRVWLQRNRPELAAGPEPDQQRRFRIGQQVDQAARDRFPEGHLVPYRPDPEAMIPITQEFLRAGQKTLFQATFAHKDLLIKADILNREESGWHLIEVKSGTKYEKEEHLPDIAFQWYVLQQAGLVLNRASIMHLNKACRFPQLETLFSLTDVTDDVMRFQAEIEANLDILRADLSQSTAPIVDIGRHCQKPYTCPFRDHCWQHIEGWTIHHIPYLRPNEKAEFTASNMLYVSDIPSSFRLGDRRAQDFVDLFNQRLVQIDTTAIKAALADLEYPLYFFDFETIDFAIPQFAGCAPYDQLPFQYSCHVMFANGALEHRDFLYSGTGDPRIDLVTALLQDIGPGGHLVAYNISFERMILRRLAEHFPSHAEDLIVMADRLWDQLGVFRSHYRDYRFGGSNSLKSVVPVLVPELSYDDLSVQNGSAAQAAWVEMIQCEDERTKEQLAENLRAYCHLDTLAMVKIHEVLQQL